MFKSATEPTLRELAKFLTDNSIPRGAIVAVANNFSGHVEALYDDAYTGLVEAVLDIDGVEDGDEVEITGLVPGAAYEMTLFASTAASTTGASTDRRRRIYEETGASGPDMRFEESSALPVADTCSYLYSPGLTMIADAAGKLYLVYEVTPGAPGDDITETVTLHLRPL